MFHTANRYHIYLHTHIYILTRYIYITDKHVSNFDQCHKTLTHYELDKL